MDTKPFVSAMSPYRTTSPRRRLLAAVAGTFAGGGALLAGLGAEGKKKSRKKRKKPATPLQSAYQCPGPQEGTFFGDATYRLAQTFTASRDGTLREIRFAIVKEAATAGDHVVQLIKVTGGVPSNSPVDVLAAVTIPAADIPAGASTLTARFGGTTLAQNTDYAAAIGFLGPDGVDVERRVGGTDCAGRAFQAIADGAFVSLVNFDLVVSVLVV